MGRSLRRQSVRQLCVRRLPSRQCRCAVPGASTRRSVDTAVSGCRVYASNPPCMPTQDRRNSRTSRCTTRTTQACVHFLTRCDALSSFEVVSYAADYLFCMQLAEKPILLLPKMNEERSVHQENLPQSLRHTQATLCGFVGPSHSAAEIPGTTSGLHASWGTWCTLTLVFFFAATTSCTMAMTN